MPKRKNLVQPAVVDSEKKSTVKKIPASLKRAARSTLLAAGLTVAQWSVDIDPTEVKLFSPGVVDRLRAPITRFHD